MLKFIGDRLKERSTWVGILSIITVAGISLSPEQQEAIILAGTAIVAAVFTFTPDK
jgi:hypothetical protein